MAPRTKPSAPPLAHYLEKQPSPVHERNVQWIKDNIGYDADLTTAQLVISTYQQFQRSDFNKAGNAEDREAREAAREERRAAAAARKEASAAKKAAAKKAPAKKAAAKKAPPAKKAAPAKKAPPTKATPKPRPRKRTANSTAAF